MKKQSTFSLKDHLFNIETVSTLAGWFFQNTTSFNAKQFIHDCMAEFPGLELKQRISHITQVLYRYLPQDYPTAVETILQSLPPALDPTKTDNDFGEFIIAPLAEYISTYGCSEEHLDISWHTLTEITKRFSVEFAVRKFINTFPDVMYANFLQLSKSSNYHQRRLVSEGSHITLPWAEKITTRDETQVIALLDQLYMDPTRYVTRSVANNLNGISKTYPELVFQTLQKRQHQGGQKPDEFQWIQKHSLRTLLKQGNAQAYMMLGYHDPSHIMLKKLVASTQVRIGEYFEIGFDLIATDGILGKCSIRYAIGCLKKNGTYAQKVYTIADIDTQESSIHFDKRQPMRLMTTRALHPGIHTWNIIVNGRVMCEGSFELYT